MGEYEQYPDYTPISQLSEEDMSKYKRFMNGVSGLLLSGVVTASYIHHEQGGDPVVSSYIATGGVGLSLLCHYMRRGRMESYRESLEQ